MMTTYRVTVDKNGNRRWFNEESELHREDGPAFERSDGSKEWYTKNQLHRLDGPAIEHINGDKIWYTNNLRHREDGPAVIYTNGYKEWWLKGLKFSEEEFLRRTGKASYSEHQSQAFQEIVINDTRYKLVPIDEKGK